MTVTLKRFFLGFGLAAACGDGGKTTDAGTGGSTDTTATTTVTTTAVTGGVTTGNPTTDPSSTHGESDSLGGTSTGTSGTTTTSGTTRGTSGPGTTSGTSTGDSTTGSSGGESSGGESSSGGGDMCSGEGDSCASRGELCCKGLDCCAGVPVPRGKEFCSDNCPVSDRNAKTEFAAIDPAEVLRRVVDLPITTWRYRKDEAVVRHMGPMAQDFHAAFGLWNTDTMIFPLDASGVSMAAIQGLHTRILATETENEQLRARLEQLERRLDESIPRSSRR